MRPLQPVALDLTGVWVVNSPGLAGAGPLQPVALDLLGVWVVNYPGISGSAADISGWFADRAF